MGEIYEAAGLLGSEEVIPEVMNLMGKYEIGKLLGRGAFAKVYHARNVSTGQSVAIKAVCKQKVLKGGFTGNIKREISIMRRLRHPNIVKIHEVLATKSKVYFIMEFAKSGELFTKVAKGRFSEDLSRRYFQQLISAVGFCHSRGVFHRDLKLENLLLDENFELKVTDFGLSAVQDQVRPDGLLHTLCGTPAYVAPEILAKKGYDGSKVDMWSCGIILFVLTAGYLPFNDQNLMVMYRKIYRGEFRCPKWMSPDLKRLLSRLLDTDPETRITVDEILHDPWFTKGHNKEIDHKFEFRDYYDWKEYGGEDDDSRSAKFLNAFDIISFSSGLDLSGLLTDSFEVPGIGEPDRFISAEEPERILDRVEGVARDEEENVSVVERNEWGVRLEGQDGKFTACIKIDRLTEGLVLVEVGRVPSGDECGWGIWKDKLQPCLRDLTYQPDDRVSGS